METVAVGLIGVGLIGVGSALVVLVRLRGQLERLGEQVDRVARRVEALPPDLSRVFGNRDRHITADLAQRVDAFLADDPAGSFRNRRSVLVTIGGRTLMERHQQSIRLIGGTDWSSGARSDSAACLEISRVEVAGAGR